MMFNRRFSYPGELDAFHLCCIVPLNEYALDGGSMTISKNISGKYAIHIAAWSIPIAVYFLFFYPYARIAALDFESLAVNLVQEWSPTVTQVWYADRDFVPIARLLLSFGALPLIAVFGASVIYRIFLKPREQSSPLASLSIKIKACLGFFILVSFTLFSIPLCLAFSVWIGVETFWWIQWYANIEPAMENILSYAPLIPAPGLFVLMLWMTHFSFSHNSKGEGVKSWLLIARRALIFIIAILPLSLLLVASAAAGVHLLRVPGGQGRTLFENKCGDCHDLALSLYFIKTPVEWRRTMKVQREVEGVVLTEPENEALTDFLVGMRSFSDKWTFNSRCLRCHYDSHEDWERRKPEDWAAITRRIARWSPYYYRPDVRNQIVAHLVNVKSDHNGALGLDEESYRRFHLLDAACSACHPLSYESDRYTGATADELAAVVKRMGRKLPNPWDETEGEMFVDSYREVIAAPMLFKKLFPHDQPIKEGGIPW
jgi:hypothetical protein